MTPFARAFLFTTTFLLLTGCDGDSTVLSWLKDKVQPRAETRLVFQKDKGPYQFQTASGSYLSGRFAQNNFDWSNAYAYLSSIPDADGSNLELKRRTMVLAMGAGHYKQAFSEAREIVAKGDDGSLPRLFLTLEIFRDGRYPDVLKEISGMPKDGISEFINPLIQAWAKAGMAQTDISGLDGNVVHVYHAILISDYLNNKDALKKLAERDFTQMNLSGKSLERIADIFAAHGLSQQAQVLYASVRNVDPKRAQNLSSKLDRLDKGESGERDDKIDSPVDGLAKALFDMASVLYSEYEDSARLFAQMSLYLDPQINDSRILLGHMSSRYGRYDEAIAYFQQIDAGKNKPLYIKLQRQIAELLAESGQEDEAIAVLRRLVVKTANVDAQIQIGDIERKREDYKQALREYNKAVGMLGDTVPQEYWNLMYARGMTNERLKNWDQAEKDLKAALAYEPDHPYILNYLGYSWADQGINLDKAAEMIARAARLRPDDGYIVDSLGWVYYRMKKFSDATRTLEQAVELLPSDPTVNDHLGDAYWQVGRKAEARFQWKRALSFSKEQEQIDMLTRKIDSGLVTDKADNTYPKPEKQARNDGSALQDAP